MLPFLKALAEPRKLLFYGSLYAIYGMRRVTGTGAVIETRGPGHTRPNLTWKIFAYLGLKPVRDGKGACPVYYHYDDTTVAACEGAINGRCVDISKSTVGRVFAEVFGYALDIDPREHHGKIVRKSEINAVHDGEVLEGPITMPQPGSVYQRLIDNTTDDGMVLDLRTGIVGNEVPYVFLKYRPRDIRFSNDNAYVRLGQPDLFTPEEKALILRFCRAIGLDIGELDILRDRESGKIYIVDVAKTPHSPSDNFITLGGLKAIRAGALAFRRQFLEGGATLPA
ncbi:ATP-grasp domain-containing protein [Novosphingobium huizhouense]|uniref:hypothetical protein n=1 Tax=Novosphingobium huizhouense TaxID=2866625 RepID=UPI001CD89497|nr:hypothetical protein [Novosphingobium huizhouense]